MADSNDEDELARERTEGMRPEVATEEIAMTEPTVTRTRTVFLTLPAHMLRAEDIIIFPETVAGEVIDPEANPLSVVTHVGASADPYLDDAEPVTLITANGAGFEFIDHVDPQRRFHVARREEPIVAHSCEGQVPCADCVD